jgi:hypothetical protein
MVDSLRVPAVLQGPAEIGANLLGHYIRDRLAPNTGPYYSGSMFETFLAPTNPHRITAEDVLAVTMLAVNYPGNATLRILGDLAPTITAHLQHIPTDLDLADAAEYIGRDSHAWKLWTLLKKLHMVGPTLTSKLMARKRPALIPVQDSHISAATGLPADGDLWSGLHKLLNDENRQLVAKLQEIRTLAGVSDTFTDLRVFDIVVWMDSSAAAAKARQAHAEDR